MINLREIRKENDLYYQGAFWIEADSVIDIFRGNFSLIGIKLESDYNGNYLNLQRSKSSLTHSRIWKELLNNLSNIDFTHKYKDEDYTYLPRGRVSIYNGIAFIHLNSKMNIPKVINKIVDEYNLHKLELEIDLNDEYQGSHYDFTLK